MATVRELVWEYLETRPDRSATQLAKALNVPLATLSSVLKRAVDRGHLIRHKGGPRGGYVYARNPASCFNEPIPSAWDRLNRDDDSV